MALQKDNGQLQKTQARKGKRTKGEILIADTRTNEEWQNALRSV